MVLVQVAEPLPPELRFALPVPGREWKRLQGLPKPEGAQLLASITAPKGPSFGLVKVYSLVPDQEVNPLDFLRYFLALNEVKLLQSRLSLTGGGLTAEALGLIPASQGSPGEPVVMRAAVYRSGNHFFVVRCTASQSQFLPLSQAFAVVTGFFAPQTLKPDALIGNWQKYCIADQFCYTGPRQGWSRVPLEKGQIEDVFVLSQGETKTGFLHVKTVQQPMSQATSPQDRIDVLTEA